MRIAAALPDQPLSYRKGSDEVIVEDLSSDYTEKYRPQFHYTCNHGFMNDPNGLLYCDGEYHLFMQHLGGSGHAVSKDLVHWVQLEQALTPDNIGACWSGSAVVDKDNTAGFQSGKEKVLVALYACYRVTPVNPTETYAAGAVHCLQQRSRTHLDQVRGQPRRAQQDRDPKMFWHEAAKRWCMVLYQCPPGRAYLSSPDLKHWTKEGESLRQRVPRPGGTAGGRRAQRAEVDRDNGRRHVFRGRLRRQRVQVRRSRPARGVRQEFLRDADVQRHSQIRRPLHPDHLDERRGAVPAHADGGPADDLPSRTHPAPLCGGAANVRQPRREIEKLYKKEHVFKDQAFGAGENPLKGLSGDLFDVRLEVEPGEASEIGLRVRGEPIRYLVKDAAMVCGEGKAPAALEGGRLKLRVLVDRVSLESFAQDGKATISAKSCPRIPPRRWSFTRSAVRPGWFRQAYGS